MSMLVKSAAGERWTATHSTHTHLHTGPGNKNCQHLYRNNFMIKEVKTKSSWNNQKPKLCKHRQSEKKRRQRKIHIFIHPFEFLPFFVFAFSFFASTTQLTTDDVAVTVESCGLIAQRRRRRSELFYGWSKWSGSERGRAVRASKRKHYSIKCTANWYWNQVFLYSIVAFAFDKKRFPCVGFAMAGRQTRKTVHKCESA